MKLRINTEDIIQIAIGAFALAVPISFTEEAWKMSVTLPFYNLLLVFILSVTFLGFYAYYSVFQKQVSKRYDIFILRIFIAYFISALVVVLVLLALNKLPVIDEPLIALKRLILITMPASMGAIVVDSFNKE
ncbi:MULTISPECIES: DUF2391 family protein [Sulfurovum]|uniref:DUF2391 family protein n=1 Tax=Sulfurovum xiamenensis TaxID=3019066 RepID=A0ABT7QQT5_9BACT|nr:MULTISPECIES: DUF2391 family protein [Sulfurovum]EIF51723.1 hypothetical protein SULAR_02628 [Sulfurovum sp. AR]MDM5263439.1 DUF2391 family protein [Sulfurovum xiamenensis]